MNKSFKLVWGKKEIYVGTEYPVLVNQLVGMNDESQYEENIKKIDMWDQNNNGPDIITDVSLCAFKNPVSIWKYALQKERYVVGTVPVYYFPPLNTTVNLRDPSE